MNWKQLHLQIRVFAFCIEAQNRDNILPSNEQK
jgi:hypothetical protein